MVIFYGRKEVHGNRRAGTGLSEKVACEERFDGSLKVRIESTGNCRKGSGERHNYVTSEKIIGGHSS